MGLSQNGSERKCVAPSRLPVAKTPTSLELARVAFACTQGAAASRTSPQICGASSPSDFVQPFCTLNCCCLLSRCVAHYPGVHLLSASQSDLMCASILAPTARFGVNDATTHGDTIGPTALFPALEGARSTSLLSVEPAGRYGPNTCFTAGGKQIALVHCSSSTGSSGKHGHTKMLRSFFDHLFCGESAHALPVVLQVSFG